VLIRDDKLQLSTKRVVSEQDNKAQDSLAFKVALYEQTNIKTDKHE